MMGTRKYLAEVSQIKAVLDGPGFGRATTPTRRICRRKGLHQSRAEEMVALLALKDSPSVSPTSAD